MRSASVFHLALGHYLHNFNVRRNDPATAAWACASPDRPMLMLMLMLNKVVEPF
jgi:hypothetical protein